MGTLIAGIIVVAAVALAVFAIVRDRKNGKSSCGSNCGHCPMSGSCHNKASLKKKGLHVTLLGIEGMSCPMCEAHINDAVRNAFKIKKIKTSHKTGISEIYSKEKLDESLLRKTIEDTGYKIISFVQD